MTKTKKKGKSEWIRKHPLATTVGLGVGLLGTGIVLLESGQIVGIYPLGFGAVPITQSVLEKMIEKKSKKLKKVI